MDSLPKQLTEVLTIDRFRWAELEIEVYLPRPNAQRRKLRSRDIDRRLATLEESQAPAIDLLMDTYEQIYAMALGEEDEQANRSSIMSAVKWVLCSFRSLTASELLHAVSIQSDGTHEDDLTEEMILSPCSNLFIKDARGLIRLAHLSVRQFFETRHSDKFSPGSQHHQAALSSLLMVRAFRNSEYQLASKTILMAKDKQDQLQTSQNSFTVYCRQNWAAHYRLSDESDELKIALQAAKSSLDHPYQNLLSYATSSCGFPACQILTMDGDCILTRSWIDDHIHMFFPIPKGDQPQSHVTRLSVEFGSLCRWIRSGPRVPLLMDSERIPLYMAELVCNWNEDFQVHAAEVIDIREADSTGNTPLHHASYFDQPRMITTLLETSVDKSAKHERRDIPSHRSLCECCG